MSASSALRLVEIERVETLGKPAVDRREKLAEREVQVEPDSAG